MNIFIDMHAQVHIYIDIYIYIYICTYVHTLYFFLFQKAHHPLFSANRLTFVANPLAFVTCVQHRLLWCLLFASKSFDVELIICLRIVCCLSFACNRLKKIDVGTYMCIFMDINISTQTLPPSQIPPS